VAWGAEGEKGKGKEVAPAMEPAERVLELERELKSMTSEKSHYQHRAMNAELRKTKLEKLEKTFCEMKEFATAKILEQVCSPHLLSLILLSEVIYVYYHPQLAEPYISTFTTPTDQALLILVIVWALPIRMT
jgi:hypothetical protein